MSVKNSERKNLVLGGGGFIGGDLCALLREKGERVRILDHHFGQELEESNRYIRDFRWADRVWILAWPGVAGAPLTKHHTGNLYLSKLMTANMRMCLSVFGALEKTKKRFLFVSSQLAGMRTPYGAMKLAAEVWTTLLGGYVARLWNPYGWEGLTRKSHVVTDMVGQGILKKRIALMSNGEEKRQFLYVRDCTEGLLYQFDHGQPYADVTNGKWISVKHVATLIAKELGVPLVMGTQKAPPSFSEAKFFLKGWKPRFTLKKGLRTVIEKARNELSGQTL